MKNGKKKWARGEGPRGIMGICPNRFYPVTNSGVVLALCCSHSWPQYSKTVDSPEFKTAGHMLIGCFNKERGCSVMA